jgi:hypothetical protein
MWMPSGEWWSLSEPGGKPAMRHYHYSQGKRCRFEMSSYRIRADRIGNFKAYAAI